MPAILPSSRRATISASWSSNARSGAGASGRPVRRRLTAASWSTPRARRFSSTPARSSAGVCARKPATVVVATRADLRHQGQVGRVRVQGLADQLVGDVGPVVLRRVDVVDPELDGAAQHRQGRGAILRRPHDPRAGELHRAEADPANCEPTERVGAGRGGVQRHDWRLLVERRALSRAQALGRRFRASRPCGSSRSPSSGSRPRSSRTGGSCSGRVCRCRTPVRRRRPPAARRS